MAFSVQAIRYGWVALASLGVITGTTIYVTNNQRHQVKPQDIIEIALGTYERCLATQTSTNPVIYSVAPTNLVQSWVKTNALVLNGKAYKVCYTSYWPSTTGVGTVQSYTSSVQPSINYAVSWTATNGWVWTNVSTWPSITVTDAYETVTNTIGWFPDRDYMISLDTTIKALVPYYVDTNTVYDGTTNIVMLTVTGLWASLGIGDKTNKFTREPAWTNPVSTNWIVNYTSYWPSTNGVAININYTSDYRQVVNYAQSWTATGGHVWVTASNWASSVVTVTNAATYGAYSDYPWQIYVEDLQERYKVLNALKIRIDTENKWENKGENNSRSVSTSTGYPYDTNKCQTAWDATNNIPDASSAPTIRSDSIFVNLQNFVLGLTHTYSYPLAPPITSSIPRTITVYLRASIPRSNIFDANGENVTENTWTKTETITEPANFSRVFRIPASGDYPTWGNMAVQFWGQHLMRGCVVANKLVMDCHFNYCTNRFW